MEVVNSLKIIHCMDLKNKKKDIQKAELKQIHW